MNLRINLDNILSALAKDQESSLEELYHYFYPRLYEFSRSFLKQEQDIDDILQEVFIRIWLNRKKIKDPATFDSYIFTITRNLLLNKLRSRLNHQKLNEEMRKLSVAKEYENIDLLQYQELKHRVEELIDQLPERQKEIFVLSRTEGMSHKEIANRMEITTKTVEYHISLAIKFLKEKLNGHGTMSLLACFLIPFFSFTF
jgi:RNA polymerase sigma-70 factor (ECF subfamily)